MLKTLVVLVRHNGDASATGRELGINQPSMSKRLAVMHRPGHLLPAPWLDRTGHTWSLTPAGERAFPTVQEIVRRYAQLIGEPADDPAGPLVAFGCGQTAAAGVVREAVKGFRRDHPGVRVRVRVLRGRQRVEELAAGGLDLAEIPYDPTTTRQVSGRPLVAWPLSVEPLVVVAGTRSPGGVALAGTPDGVPLRPKGLAGLGVPFLLPDPGSAARRGFDAAMAKAGVSDRVTVGLEAGGWGVLAGYARDGHGLAVVSRAGLGDRPAGVVVRPLDAGAFPPVRTWLAARRRSGSKTAPDLTSEADAFRMAVLAAAGM